MAGRYGVATATGLATTAIAKTLLQLLSVNIAIKVIEIGIGFHGISNTAEPGLVELVRQSTAGTMSANTPVKGDDSVADALNTTSLEDASSEPASGDVLRTWTIHPQNGLAFQMHDLAPIIVGAGDRIGVRVTFAAGINADVHLAFEE